MSFVQALVIAAVPSVAAIVTAWVAFRDLGLRRRLETSQKFLTFFATAHGRPTDGRDGVGAGEQVATVHLIADFAIREKLVREAARAGLGYIAAWSAPVENVSEIAPQLEFPDGATEVQRQQAAQIAQAVSRYSRGQGHDEIAEAAAAALARLNERRPTRKGTRSEH